MNRMAMESLARKHWAKWLPRKVAQLKADGDLSEAIQGAATAANRCAGQERSGHYRSVIVIP